MCERCAAAVTQYYPDCPADEMGNFLFGATSFPAGGPEDIERQLREASEAGCQTYREAMAYAARETERAMK